MNVNPAGYAMPTHHEALFAQGRVLTPQQSHQQPPPYFSPAIPGSYPQSQTPQQAYHASQPFAGGFAPPPGNGIGGFGGGGMMQPGFQPQTPISQPNYSIPPHAQGPIPTSAPPSNFHPPSLPASTVAMATPMQTTPMNMNTQHHQPRPNPQMQQQQSQMPTHRPLSPASAAREKARVSTLLEINSALLQEVVSLQNQGKAGAPATTGQTSPSQSTPTDPTAPSPTTTPIIETPTDPVTGKPIQKQPSKEFFDCMRRLQANLAYLATIADRAKKPGAVNPAGPAILDPPPHMQSLYELYGKLKALFPSAGRAGGNQQSGQQKHGMQAERANAGMAMPTTA